MKTWFEKQKQKNTDTEIKKEFKKKDYVEIVILACAVLLGIYGAFFNHDFLGSTKVGYLFLAVASSILLSVGLFRKKFSAFGTIAIFGLFFLLLRG